MKGRKTGEGRVKGRTFLFIFIVSGAQKKRPLRVRLQFFSTVFINPDIYIAKIIRSRARRIGFPFSPYFCHFKWPECFIIKVMLVASLQPSSLEGD